MKSLTALIAALIIIALVCTSGVPRLNEVQVVQPDKAAPAADIHRNVNAAYMFGARTDGEDEVYVIRLIIGKGAVLKVISEIEFKR